MGALCFLSAPWFFFRRAMRGWRRNGERVRDGKFGTKGKRCIVVAGEKCPFGVCCQFGLRGVCIGVQTSAQSTGPHPSRLRQATRRHGPQKYRPQRPVKRHPVRCGDIVTRCNARMDWATRSPAAAPALKWTSGRLRVMRVEFWSPRIGRGAQL